MPRKRHWYRRSSNKESPFALTSNFCRTKLSTNNDATTTCYALWKRPRLLLSPYRSQSRRTHPPKKQSPKRALKRSKSRVRSGPVHLSKWLSRLSSQKSTSDRRTWIARLMWWFFCNTMLKGAFRKSLQQFTRNQNKICSPQKPKYSELTLAHLCISGSNAT